jgi:UDP-2,4-diacetamido-2,4,6-trideoxy-beta-L-altropyranose hydrolase
MIRADASLQIGIGHVMRCLTLAEGLKKKTAQVEFICCEHEGNMIQYIESRGFKVRSISIPKRDANASILSNLDISNTLDHGHWLGNTQAQDADVCNLILRNFRPDWLIVDHYSLDQVWEMKVEDACKKLMVIDDLADRHHSCDILLDQTYGRSVNDYNKLTPPKCLKLIGSKYALLRPEFEKWRGYSLRRRKNAEFKKILITMGGVDNLNVTEMVLEELKKCDLPIDIAVIVVMGVTSPYLESVRRKINSLPFKAEIKSNVTNMAEVMANSDIAIGASGATTWERCCLGLPTIQVVVAQNQTIIANHISKSGAALSITIDQLGQLKNHMIVLKRQVMEVVEKSAEVTDGRGLMQVLTHLK